MGSYTSAKAAKAVLEYMYSIDIGWNSNWTLLRTEKANRVIIKSSGADPSPSHGEHGSSTSCCVLGSRMAPRGGLNMMSTIQ